MKGYQMTKNSQIMLQGTETPISLAADDFLEALKDYQMSKEVYQNARKDMAKALNTAGLNKIHHGGKCIEFVEGKQIEDSVKVSEDRNG
jgi:hypothetical protein